MTEIQLRGLLLKILKFSGYEKVIDNGLYIFAEGQLPICLLAHMDTVFPKPPTDIFFDQEQHIMWSPQGLGADDRAGIYAIIRLIKMGYRPSIIFTDLEEQGGIGSSWLVKDFPRCPFKGCKALIQIDRRHGLDSVYYDCANKEFEEKINSYGFITDFGSFTDISIIAPIWGVAAVNLSTGYYNEHSPTEYLNMEELESTISKIGFMLKHCSTWPCYNYVEIKDPTKDEWLSQKYDYIESNDNEDVWWSQDQCVCCSRKFTDKEEKHLCPSTDPKYNFYVCDECYNAYF